MARFLRFCPTLVSIYESEGIFLKFRLEITKKWTNFQKNYWMLLKLFPCSFFGCNESSIRYFNYKMLTFFVYRMFLKLIIGKVYRATDYESKDIQVNPLNFKSLFILKQCHLFLKEFIESDYCSKIICCIVFATLNFKMCSWIRIYRETIVHKHAISRKTDQVLKNHRDIWIKSEILESKYSRKY